MRLAVLYLYCVVIDTAIQSIKHCEQDLRKLVAKAAESGDYAAVMTLTDWAKTLAGLAPSAAAPTPSFAAPQPEAAPKRTKYPKFVRHGDELVKYGWSKTKRREYQHRASRAMLTKLVGRLAAVGSPSKVRPATDFLFDGAKEGDAPNYQFYLCLAWLRSLDIVVQHGRQGYTLPNPSAITSAVDSAWKSLREE
jgi:hypothetical protein